MERSDEVNYGEPAIVYQGQIFEVEQRRVKFGEKENLFELARRAPGTRNIIIKDNKILLSKEYRHESKDIDWRLPGGKVFDMLDQYKKALKYHSNILEYATRAAEKECREETGLIPKNIKHFYTTSPTATIKWDLYYFVVNEFEEVVQDLGDGESIETEWKNKDEVFQMCLDGSISEERTALVLIRYLEGKLT